MLLRSNFWKCLVFKNGQRRISNILALQHLEYFKFLNISKRLWIDLPVTTLAVWFPENNTLKHTLCTLEHYPANQIQAFNSSKVKVGNNWQQAAELLEINKLIYVHPMWSALNLCELLVDCVGSSHYVSKLDLLKGYWQVPLTPLASEISAFVSPDAFMQYTVMVFGMHNAPATFQRLMQIVLSEVQNCEVYLDNVVKYSMTWEDLLWNLSSVIEHDTQPQQVWACQGSSDLPW